MADVPIEPKVCLFCAWGLHDDCRGYDYFLVPTEPSAHIAVLKLSCGCSCRAPAPVDIPAADL